MGKPMQSNSLTNSGARAQELAAGLRLHEGEQLVATYATMLPMHALLWFLLLFGSSGTGLGIAMAISWLVPGGDGLRLYDRVLRLVLQVNAALFGPHVAYLTSQRLVIEVPGREEESIALGNFTGTETHVFRLGGNLFVHLGGPVKRRLGLWVVCRNEVAEQIRATCQQRR